VCRWTDDYNTGEWQQRRVSCVLPLWGTFDASGQVKDWALNGNETQLGAAATSPRGSYCGRILKDACTARGAKCANDDECGGADFCFQCATDSNSQSLAGYHCPTDDGWWKSPVPNKHQARVSSTLFVAAFSDF
jgi:hypothetical protein